MHHTAAYTAAIDNTANTDVAALSDDILAISNGHFLPQRNYGLLFGYVGSATLSRARFVSPSNRQVTLPFLRPINLGTLPTSRPAVADYRQNPFGIKALEELAIEATSAIAMGTERFTAVIGLDAGRTAMPRGDVFTIRGTSSTAAVANTWSAVTMTWADALPAGNYGIVGGVFQSTNCIAGRLLLENQYERPGAIGNTALGNLENDMFRMGGLGMWGVFRSTRMPLVQQLCNGADASHEVYLDIIRLP